MAADPAFAATPVRPASISFGTTLITDIKVTNPDNTTKLIAGVNTGTKINEIVLQAAGTTVAGFVCVYIVASDTTWHLFDQVPIPAITFATTTMLWRRTLKYDNLILVGTAQSIYLGTTHTQTHAIRAHVEASTF